MTKKKWNKKELGKFKDVISNRRDEILSSIEQARTRADDIIKEPLGGANNDYVRSADYVKELADFIKDELSKLD